MRVNPNRPQAERARGQVRDAIRRGEISAASRCEKCGAENRACSDGRRYLHAHHVDHHRALDIEWLCAKCHRKETPLPNGERNGQARLSVSKVEKAILMARAGAKFTEIAMLYGVDRSTISRAVNEKRWLAARKAKL